jgi:adenylate kinase
MKKKTLFMGGAKGTGKTTLCRALSICFNLPILNTGDFFSVQTPIEESKRRIINFIIKKSPLIVDTHYAGFIGGIYSGKFERGLYNQELKRLLGDIDLELVLIDLDGNTLTDRRKRDNLNTRDLDPKNASNELYHNRIFFYQYCAEIKKPGKVILNYNLQSSLGELKDYWKAISSLK